MPGTTGNMSPQMMTNVVGATMGGRPEVLRKAASELDPGHSSGAAAAQKRFASRNGGTVLGGDPTARPQNSRKTLLGQ